MDDQTTRRLVALNRAFYDTFAAPFAETRASPQPGFERLVTYLPREPLTVLDVGCGDGRFGRFLRAKGFEIHYIGVDATPNLLARAGGAAEDVLLERDLSQPGSLEGLPRFSCVACLSTLQHIPGHANRVRLLREIGAHLAPAGLLFLGNWQFLDSDRQRQKLRDWSLVGIEAQEVGPEDHLLSWDRGGQGLRYVAYLDLPATQQLIEDAGLRLIDSFRSDGREGNLNLYSIVAS